MKMHLIVVLLLVSGVCVKASASQAQARQGGKRSRAESDADQNQRRRIDGESTNNHVNGILLSLCRSERITRAQVHSWLRSSSAINVNERVGANSEFPLLVASAAGNVDMVSVLLREGADSKQVDERGRSALYVAAMNGHVGVVRVLKDVLGDDAFKELAKTQNVNSATALHVAVEYGHAGVVSALKNLLGDDAFHELVDTKIVNGKTAYDLAKEKGYDAIVELLVEGQTCDEVLRMLCASAFES